MRRACLYTTLLGICLLLSSLSYAQKEKNYLDISLQPCKKGKASYYMSIEPKGEDHELKMFDMKSVLKMTGSSADGQGRIFNGYFEFYHDNGQLESKGEYIKGRKTGIWERFDKRGNKLAERMYAAYNPTKQAFYYVDEMPMYEGGNENFLKFLKQKLQPLVNETEIAQKEAQIELGFVVSEKGEIQGVELVKGLDDGWNREALKKLQAMPLWMPGKKSGENVRVWMQLAVDLSP